MYSDIYQNTFGVKPKLNTFSPLDKGDHPELDTSELLDQDCIQKHQSLTGALQWTISLGRIDINAAMMTLSSFRVEPRKGHIDRIKMVHSYLAKMKQFQTLLSIIQFIKDINLL